MNTDWVVLKIWIQQQSHPVLFSGALLMAHWWRWKTERGGHGGKSDKRAPSVIVHLFEVRLLAILSS